MPSYVALPATPSDIPQIATLIFQSNTTDPVFTTIYPKNNTPRSLLHFVTQLEEVMDEDPSAYMMIVKDASSGDCIGYSVWHFVPRGGVRDGPRIEGGMFPVEANVELGVRVAGVSDGRRVGVLREVLAGREGDGFAYVSAIGIHPSHQRQGAASKMLDWGVDRADDKGLPVYAESTPAALRLYSKFGFQHYDKLNIDLRPVKDETVEHNCMIRLPNTT